VTADATIWDLDGTLARLVVNWNAVAEDVLAYYDDAGVATDATGVWECYDRAVGTDHEDRVNEIIASHERDGAHHSRRLAHADRLLAEDGPHAVCSLNSEAACHVALERHGLGEHVSVVVGRDSVDGRKPAPGPLVATADALGVDVDRALFVGDSRRDELAAQRAGLAFEWVGEDRSDGVTGTQD
jgi:phosphoglycolate phosphatase